MAVDVVVAVAVAGHFPSTTSTATATATATAIPPDDCPVWVRGSIMECPAIPRGSAVSSCLPRDYGPVASTQAGRDQNWLTNAHTSLGIHDVLCPESVGD